MLIRCPERASSQWMSARLRPAGPAPAEEWEPDLAADTHSVVLIKLRPSLASSARSPASAGRPSCAETERRRLVEHDASVPADQRAPGSPGRAWFLSDFHARHRFARWPLDHIFLDASFRLQRLEVLVLGDDRRIKRWTGRPHGAVPPCPIRSPLAVPQALARESSALHTCPDLRERGGARRRRVVAKWRETAVVARAQPDAARPGRSRILHPRWL